MKDTYKRAQRKLRDILTLTEVFDQKKVNVSEHSEDKSLSINKCHNTLYDIITQKNPHHKLHIPPHTPSLEYQKQHSVLITAEDAQNRAKWLSCTFTNYTVVQVKWVTKV